MLAFIVTWCEVCEGRNEEKGEEIKGKVIRPFGGEEEKSERSPSEWNRGQCSLGELCEWEQAKEKRKI